MAKLLSGKQVSEEIKAKLTEDVKELSVTPKLAIVQIGGREDSNVYIRTKKNYAEAVGMKVNHLKLPRTTSEKEVSEISSKLFEREE
jgi:methylenetetrahydrofolate dehydrogenase (NADP+) / methenyltetrahydrofolate cyclohydrolase / formyltetrahydrofolate synthetase